MFNLEVVSALEVEIVVEHVSSDMDEARSEQGKEKRAKVEDVCDLERDDRPENYGNKCYLKEGSAHSLEPEH